MQPGANSSYQTLNSGPRHATAPPRIRATRPELPDAGHRGPAAR